MVRGTVVAVATVFVGCAAAQPPPVVPPMGVVALPATDMPTPNARAGTTASRPATWHDGANDPDDRRPQPTPPVLRGTGPTYVIGRIKGRSSDQLGRMLAPTQERVGACVPGTSGTVRVRVESKTGETLLTIEPDVDLDVQSRRCILEALSMMQLDDDPSKRLGPGGFTSHILISW